MAGLCPAGSCPGGLVAGGLVSYTRGAGMVICLERGADLHMAQLMPLPLTVSCVTKIEIDITFLVPAHPEVPEKGPLNGCVYQTWKWVIGSPGQWVIWVIFHVRVTGSSF